MGDRLARLSDTELGLALVALAPHLDFPEVPDVSEVVVARLQAEPVPGPAPDWAVRRLVPRRRPNRLIALAAAALLLVGSAAAAARLGIRGIGVTVSPGGGPLPPGLGGHPLGRELYLGHPTTLARAERDLAFRPLLPHISGLTKPEVYTSTLAPDGGSLTLLYGTAPGLPASRFTNLGLLLTEFLGHYDREFIHKVVFSGTRLEPVTVNGRPGLWISGAPHDIYYLDRNGNGFTETLRLSDNALLWQHGRVTLRLESGLGEAGALRIARSIG